MDLARCLNIYEKAGEKINKKVQHYLDINPNAKIKHYLLNNKCGFFGLIECYREMLNSQKPVTFQRIQRARFLLSYQYSELKCYLDLLKKNPEFRKEHLEQTPVRQGESGICHLVKKHKNEIIQRLPISANFVLNYSEIMDLDNDEFDKAICGKFARRDFLSG